MADVIRMPLLSDTMKEGVIAEWHVKVGDKVKSDDVLAEVETDKATMEVVPYVDGTVLYLGVDKGKAAKVNEIIAIIGKQGEDFKALLEPASGAAPAPAAPDMAAPASAAPASAPAAAAPAADDAALKEALKQCTVVRMPLLSDTMKEGKIVSWLRKVGDAVKSDDVLAEVETDKATMEVIGYADGTLLHIGVEAGSAAKVNEIIAIVGKPGTNIQVILDAEKAPVPSAAATQAAPPAAAAASSASAPAVSSTEGGRLKASPLARKLAEEKGIDLQQVQGSGDGGRIVKRDVDAFVPGQAPASGPAAAPAAILGQEGYQDTVLSQMRKIIARRLSESKFTAPHFYLKIEVNMDKAIEARKAMNELSPVKISFNDMIIKACALSLKQHPAVNSSWMDEFIRSYRHVHIGSAVAIEDGLIVPVIRFADQKSLSQIASEAKTLYEKAKTKKLQPSDFSGNTFTISNLGMMGIDEFTAIINPPDSCILAVGAIKETVVSDQGQFKAVNLLKLTMSCDHRVVDGALGALFLQTLKTYLENPVTMLV